MVQALLTSIVFPRLGWSFEIDRVAFRLFGMDVYWYGIIIAVGFLLAVLYCFKYAKRYAIDPDDLTNMLLFAVPLSIIGARTYYVVFMYNEYYYGQPALWYRIWDGGMAIYGAIIMGVLTCVVYCYIRRIRMGTMLDLCVMGLLIGQCIGRWGNFVNGEAYGTVTYAYPWIMQVNGGPSVHPCFLYESVWNLVGFLILHFYSKKRRYCGEIFLIYVAWYGIGRGLIEGLRTDSLYLWGTSLRISQAIGYITAILALGVLVYLYLFREPDEEKLKTPYYTRLSRKQRKALENAPEEAIYEEESFEPMIGDEAEDESDEDFYGEQASSDEPETAPEETAEEASDEEEASEDEEETSDEEEGTSVAEEAPEEEKEKEE